MSTLRESFIEELRDLYDAEKQLLKALPKMAKAAEHEELKSAFEEHLQQTQEHVERLERVFEAIDEQPRGKKCKGMQGLIEEGSEHIKEDSGDAALICAAQKAEHYEIAAYGSLAAWGELMEESEAVSLLQETLEEEKETDEKLTDLAERIINPEEESEDDDDDGGMRAGSKTASRAKKR
jgi:ferritin-like metal-binding protein YciE